MMMGESGRGGGQGREKGERSGGKGKGEANRDPG